MKRWMPPNTFFPAVERWRSREEILKAHLDSLSSEELQRVRPDRWALTFGWDFERRGYQRGALLIADLEEKAGFRRNQPRWARGNPKIGGRWSGGAGTGAPVEGGNSSTPTRGGHHFVPRKIFEKEPLRPETRAVFERGVTGPLNAGPHRNSTEHLAYNDAVSEKYRTFLRENGSRAEDMTPEQAGKLLDEIKRSSDPRIRTFNMRIYMREIMYWMRRGPRGRE